MKLFTTIAFAASLFALTVAQGIDIGAPLSGTSVLPGQNITVEVDRPVCTSTVPLLLCSN